MSIIPLLVVGKSYGWLGVPLICFTYQGVVLAFQDLTSNAADSNNHIAVLLAGQAALLVTTLIGLWLQVYRENRTRRWLLEDADRLAKKVEAEATKTAEHTERIVRHVGGNVSQVITSRSDEADVARKALAEKVDEGIKASHAALKEANDVNSKIASLGVQIVEARETK